MSVVVAFVRLFCVVYFRLLSSAFIISLTLFRNVSIFFLVVGGMQTVAVNFQSDATGGSIYLSTVSFQPNTAELRSPVKLVINTENEQQTLRLPNGVEFRDINNNLVYNRVTVAPHSSIVLLDKGFQANLTETEAPTQTSK